MQVSVSIQFFKPTVLEHQTSHQRQNPMNGHRNKWETRLGVDKVKPKGWFKYF